MGNNLGDRVVQTTALEKKNYDTLLELYKRSPIPANEQLDQLALFIRRKPMSRVIFMYELYKKILNVHGVVMEFGVRWGQNQALFESFRGMLEPFNYNRRLIGFDTFSGFPSISDQDKNTAVGDMKVTDQYESFLEAVLTEHENSSPLNHMKKYELVKGDATVTFKKYLQEHPETIIALAYFDFDIYEPTKVCLDLCKGHLTKGSVLAFDELNHPDWPGETVALRESIGLDKYRIERLPFMPTISFLVIE